MTDLFDAGLWETVADLARRKGVARQSLHERVDRLEADGLITVRREGRAKLINVAEYDRAVGEVGDAAKEAGAETKYDDDAEGATSSYRDHQAREKQYAADLKYLELQERLGKLVPVDDLAEAASKCAEACVRVIERLPSQAESMAAAVGRDGAAGARVKFKEIARELREGIASAFGELAGSDAGRDVAASTPSSQHAE